MTWWAMFGILTAAALVMSCVGFYEFVWFLSVGYGLAVCGVGIADLIIGFVTGTFTSGATGIVLALQALVFVIYGFRLGGFLLIRELKNAAYKKTLESTGAAKRLPIFVAVPIWVVCAILYVGETAGVSFKMMNHITLGDDIGGIVLPLIGLIIMICGAACEAIADKQKSAQKKEDPNMVATKGLYKFVRCPNYFGEVLFWTGVFISGFNAYRSVGQWIFAVICWISIVYIMFNGCQRLDKRQSKRLKGNAQFEEYASNTPILIPFIPWKYHCDIDAVEAAEAEKAAKKAAKKAEKEGK